MSGEFNDGREAIAQGEKLKGFYQLVTSEYPEGLAGHQNSFPVNIGGREMSAILFGEYEPGKVSIGIFIEGTKYARKTLEIDAQGHVGEDTEGVIPKFDITDNEPDFSTMTNEQIAEIVIDAMNLKGGKEDKENLKAIAESRMVALEQRLSQRDPNLRIGIVNGEPQSGQMTVQELASLDSGKDEGGDFASTAFVNLYINDGRYNKEQFIHDLSGVDEYEGEADEDKPSPKELARFTERATEVVNKMLKLGLLQERNGRIYSNIETIRK